MNSEHKLATLINNVIGGSCQMEVEESVGESGPVAGICGVWGIWGVWRMFSSPLVALLASPLHGHHELRSLMQSIINSTREFSEVLVQRSQLPDENTKYYSAFNKWLLGVFFYILKLEELDTIHSVSVEAQLKLLKILYTNRASFYEEIVTEYLSILKDLIAFNDSDTKDDCLIIHKFKFDENEMKIKDLNLTSVTITVNDKANSRNLMKHVMKILGETIAFSDIMSSHIEEEFYECLDNVMSKYSIDLKCSVMSARCKIYSHRGILLRENHTKRFLLYVKELVQNELLWQTSNSEDLNNLTTQLDEFYAILSSIKTNKSYNFTESDRTGFMHKKDDKQFFRNNILLLLSEFNTTDLEVYENISVFEIPINTLIRKLSDETLNLFEDNVDDLWKKMMENSHSYRKVCSELDILSSMEMPRSITDVIEHLKKFDYILKILIFYKIEVVKHAQKGFFKLNTSTKDLELDGSISNFNNLNLFKNEFFNNILKKVLNVSKLTLDNSTAKSSMLMFSISTKIIFLSMELTLKDLENIMKMQTSHLDQKIFSEFEGYDRYVEIIYQNVFVMKNIHSERLKKWSLHIFETSNMNNKELMLLKMGPSLIMNNIFTVDKFICDILSKSLYSKHSELQKQLVSILPTVICMTFGHCILIQTPVDVQMKFGYKIQSTDCISLQIICMSCFKKDSYKDFNLNSQLLIDCAVVMKEKTNSNIGENALNYANMLKKFLDLSQYNKDMAEEIGNILVVSARHSIIDMNSLKYFYSNYPLKTISKYLRCLNQALFDNTAFNNTQKEEVMELVIDLLLWSTKKCLENSNIEEQEICIEAIRQFALVKYSAVILPCVKLLIHFTMYPSCPFASKVCIIINEVCETHETTPNKVYHLYKKDFCRCMMELAAFNYLRGHDFAQSIFKTVKTFDFEGYREFISKDIHHALPYLIPIIVKNQKLRPIINDIATLIHCTPADFLSDRFPNIYTHVYLFVEEKQAVMCFELIENIIGVKLSVLIKKHLRIILTELLLQYCCGPEKVIKACKYLACNENDNEIVNSNMSLNQIADFIQPRFLGVLAYFDSKIVNTKVALSIKRKALQSFPDVLNLMGPSRMTPLRLKLLATLRTSLYLMEDFPILNANAWNAFVRNVDVMALGSLLTTIFASLMPLYALVPNEVSNIFEYLIIQNENILSSHIPDLFFLQDANLNSKIKTIIMKHVNNTQPQSFIDKLQWYLKYLQQDVSEIKVDVLKILTTFIKNSKTKIYDIIMNGKDNQSIIMELVNALVIGCRDLDAEVSDWSGRCLGELGAFEPFLLPRKISRQSSSISPFAFTIEDDSFAKAALYELIRAFQSEKHTKSMDCFALAIQTILKTYEISPENSNQNIWNSFPDQMIQVMTPLLNSRYTLGFPTNPDKVHPVYGSHLATSFYEWAFNWASQLIPTITPNSLQELFRMVRPSLKKDSRTLVLFLPYIVLHSILSSNEESIFEEFSAVICLQSFNTDDDVYSDKTRNKILRYKKFTPVINTVNIEEGTHLKCSKMVFEILDFLNRWILECYNSKSNGMNDVNCIKIKAFLTKFDKFTTSQSNFLCGELERSLQYLECYMEESSDRIQQHLGFLAEIYAALNEPDAVSGILGMKQTEPSLSELILAHSVTGQLQDAAICYEKYAQQGNVDDQILQDMVEVYLGLDQPYTALKLLQGSNEKYFGGSKAAEPLWRLGMFDELDNLLENNHIADDNGWGVIVGKSLLDFRNCKRDSFQGSLLNARKCLLQQLSEVTGETADETRIYTQAYDSILGLHMMSEIEQTEEILNKMKSMKDDDSRCSVILNQLVDHWNGRLKLLPTSPQTVEPVLRLRRILLEQSKHCLASSHPQIASQFDTHIGKIWLQSAKFARKASIFQQAYIYILNGEKYQPKELFIEKAKLYWMRGQQEPAFHTLKRGLEEHFSDSSQLSLFDRKLCAKAKLLIAIYNDETTNVNMDVNIDHYKKAVEMYREREKSLVYLAAYYERLYAALRQEEKVGQAGDMAKIKALDCYGKALLYGHSRLYQSMPRMLSIWLDFEINPTDTRKSAAMQNLKQICSMIDEFSGRLPDYLFLTAFSQIISRICHPIKEVYTQLKKIIIKLILAYPQHCLWMMMCVIKSSYPQRVNRWNDIMKDPRLLEARMFKLISDFKQLAEKLMELCNKPIGDKVLVTQVSTLMRTFPRLLASENFSQIIMPFEKFIKVTLPRETIAKNREPYNPFPSFVHIAGIEEKVEIFPTLQKPRKITLIGSDGNRYIILLKPKDDLRRDFRLMEFNGVVNRYLQECSDARARRLHIRTFGVLPLNEECGLIEWVPNLIGFRRIILQLYKQRGITSNMKMLKNMICPVSEDLAKKRKVFLEELLPKHPPVFGEWFRYTFPDPHSWYQARSAYIRTTAVMSMVGYILGLGDRHGENILMDSQTGDTVHVDFNCLFNKGETWEYPERVPFRLTHNMQAAMGPLGCEGMFRKCCEITLKVLRSQTPTLMSVIQPFVYDPLVAWQKMSSRLDDSCMERTNNLAREHLTHIEQRLQGMVRNKGKQTSLLLSPEGQTNYLIVEATSINNLCQMFFGWGPYL